MTATEVAEALRLSYSTVTKMAREGSLPVIKVGSSLRFRRIDIEAILTPTEAGAA